MGLAVHQHTTRLRDARASRREYHSVADTVSFDAAGNSQTDIPLLRLLQHTAAFAAPRGDSQNAR